MARMFGMLANVRLMREGWPPALFTATDRAGPPRAIRADRPDKDLEPMVRVTSEAARFMIDRYRHAIQQVREGEQARPPKHRLAPEQDRGLDR